MIAVREAHALETAHYFTLDISPNLCHKSFRLWAK